MIHALLMGLPILLGGFGCACGVSASVETQEPSHVERAVLTNPKRVSYNDSDKSITLSVDELNDYTWDNLNTTLVELQNDENVMTIFASVYYGSTMFAISDDGVSGNYYYLEVNNDDTGVDYVCFNTTGVNTNNHFYYKANSQADLSPCEETLTFNLSANAYSDVKTAIEQDIIDNANSMPSIADIFSEVTQAITAFMGSLGTAFTQVTSLFYAEGNWTFLGVLILIGVGVGILYGVYRIIKGLLHRV